MESSSPSVSRGAAKNQEIQSLQDQVKDLEEKLETLKSEQQDEAKELIFTSRYIFSSFQKVIAFKIEQHQQVKDIENKLDTLKSDNDQVLALFFFYCT